jgi:sugar phosphate isomerase/epimerase
MPKSLIACRRRSYGDFEAVAYAHLAGLGIRNVEIPMPTIEDAPGVRRELERFGLTATTLHGSCDVTRPDTAALVESQVPVMKELGTSLLFVSAQVGDTPLETAYNRLRAAGDVADKHGITIVMETHPDLATNAEVALATMRGVDHPHVRLNYDTANVYFYNEGVDAVGQLEPIVEFVSAVHLKDTNGAYRTWHFPALGRGVIDFAAVFRCLDAAGFDGPCTLEIEGIEGETKSERLICDRIAESLGYLRGLGRV